MRVVESLASKRHFYRQVFKPKVVSKFRIFENSYLLRTVFFMIHTTLI